MKWSEQMRELSSADQVYNECVIVLNNGWDVILNGKSINLPVGDPMKFDIRVPTKFKELFSDPFFLKNILFLHVSEDAYYTVKLFSISKSKNMVAINFGTTKTAFDWVNIVISDTPLEIGVD